MRKRVNLPDKRQATPGFASRCSRIVTRNTAIKRYPIVSSHRTSHRVWRNRSFAEEFNIDFVSPTARNRWPFDQAAVALVSPRPFVYGLAL